MKKKTSINFIINILFIITVVYISFELILMDFSLGSYLSYAHIFISIMLILYGGYTITSLIKLNKKIAAYKEVYRTILNLSMDGIYIENSRGEILECNKSGHEMFHYTREEMLKLSIRDLVPEEFASELPDIIPDEMATGDVYLERINKKKNGDLFFTEINSKYICLNNEKRLIVFVRDISKRKQMENELREITIRDELTKVYNRRYILKKLEDEIIRSKIENLPLSVALIDIDDFKKVNDNFGHPFGDLVLKKFSNIITKTLRKTDYLGRIGGEEFIIILSDTSLNEGYQILSRIKEKLTSMLWEKENFYVTFSAGIAEINNYNKDESSSTYIIKLTDELMYKAKSSGKNCIISSRDITPEKQ